MGFYRPPNETKLSGERKRVRCSAPLGCADGRPGTAMPGARWRVPVSVRRRGERWPLEGAPRVQTSWERSGKSGPGDRAIERRTVACGPSVWPLG